MTNNNVETAVCDVVADALGIEVSEVCLTSNLMADLGAESLDFLDIVFQLEKKFAIEISRGEMERVAKGEMSDEEFAPGGVVSRSGLVKLRTLMPEAADRICDGLRAMEILTLFSVRTFVNIVNSKRAKSAA